MIHNDAPMKQEPLIYKVACGTQSVSVYKCDLGFRLHHSGRGINHWYFPGKNLGAVLRDAGKIQLAKPRAKWRIVHDETDRY